MQITSNLCSEQNNENYFQRNLGILTSETNTKLKQQMPIFNSSLQPKNTT